MNGCLAGCTFQCIFPERKCIFWNIIREDNWKKKKKTPKLFMNGKDSTQLTMLFVSYCCLVTKSCPTLVTPWTVARQAPLSMRFPRQEYCSGLPFPSLRDLPNPGIRPMTPTLQADSLPLNHQGSPQFSSLAIEDEVTAITLEIIHQIVTKCLPCTRSYEGYRAKTGTAFLPGTFSLEKEENVYNRK